MNEFQLKYGTNPNQKPARIYMADGSDLPVQILNGRPGYINFLDAFNSWQLVRDLKKALGLPAAASFKHVSPAGAAIGLPLDDTLRAMYHIAPETELSPLACAYARARGADRMSSWSPPSSSSLRFPTASLPPATMPMPSKSSRARRRVTTTSLPSTLAMSRSRLRPAPSLA